MRNMDETGDYKLSDVADSIQALLLEKTLNYAQLKKIKLP